MYAVIRTGSKQYRVSPGDTISVEKIDVPEGKKHSFEDVVLYHDGKKLIADAKSLKKVKVDARVISQGKGEKVLSLKYKPKKGYRRKKGHRQDLTRLEIEDIIVRKSAPRKKPASKKSSGPKKEDGKTGEKSG